TTHESARGQGIFAALEAKHEREAAEQGVAVALAFASAPTAPIFLGPLGWTEIERLRVWVRTIAVLADLAAPAEELRGLVRRAAARSASRLLFALPAPEQRALFASLGFV